MKFLKSKFKIALNKKTITIISIVVLVCLVVPVVTHALLAASIARAIFGFLGKLILGLISVFVGLGANFLNAMLDIGFSGTSRAIAESGWGRTKDIANLFFILIMILIAFGTILRIERYGAKKLLPKLILIALLINFSLPLSYLFIDLSNLTAKSFVNNVQGKNETIREKLMDGVKSSLFLLPTDCDDEYKDDPQERKNCEKRNEDIKKAQGDQSWIDVIIAIIVGCIFLGLAAFVLIAGAIILIIRVLALAILVILAPLAFICYIVPSLNKYCTEWWSSLLKWCFFAPIFAFFFWLAIGTVNELSNYLANSDIAKVPATEANFMGRFFANMSNSIAYFLFIGLIMGGMIAGQKIGIAGAKATVGLAKKWQKGATGWMKRTGMRPIKAGGAAIGAKALGLTGKLFGGKIGARMQTRAAMLRQAWWEKDPKYQRFAKVMAKSSDNAVLNEMSTLGPKGILAAQEVLRRAQLTRTMDRKYAEQAAQHIRSLGDAEMLQKFKELRPDIITDEAERNAVTNKLVQEGNLNKVAAVALEDDRFVAAVSKFASAVQIESLRGTSPQHKDKITQALDRLTTAGNTIFTSMSAPDQEKIHFAYASQTGDIDRMSNAQTEKWAKEAGADGIKRIKETVSPARLRTVAENIPANQLASIVEKIQNNTVARNMVRHLKTVVITPATPPNVAANAKVAKTNPYLKNLA